VKYRIAFAGFRHGHALSLLRQAQSHPRLVVTALCEENLEASLMPENSLSPDYTSFQAMLDADQCDIVGLGDIFIKRGEQAIKALESGKHVLSDKPLCTSLEELEKIATLASKNKLCVGVMLGLRKNGNFIAMKEQIDGGRIGEIQTISITGQHPLRKGRRPDWYFEKGLHGGTFNDIGVHGIDVVQWLCGMNITSIDAARSWNAKAGFAPFFKDCAQCMLRMENGAGVLGDFSYLAPDYCGSRLENYWRTSIHGTRGFAETCAGAKAVIVADDTSSVPELVSSAEKSTASYIDDLLHEIEGVSPANSLTTESCLTSTRIALEVEKVAAR
jgi:predicted dehydrogenase